MGSFPSEREGVAQETPLRQQRNSTPYLHFGTGSTVDYPTQLLKTLILLGKVKASLLLLMRALQENRSLEHKMTEPRTLQWKQKASPVSECASDFGQKTQPSPLQPSRLTNLLRLKSSPFLEAFVGFSRPQSAALTKCSHMHRPNKPALPCLPR